MFQTSPSRAPSTHDNGEDRNGAGAAPTVGKKVEEKPQNGLAGLKHWRHDARSGFMVALISLPFSMGIAMASGAPPVCGIVSAIIAGLVLPLMGGSYVTISGPAAGLAPALFAGMLTLGFTMLGKGASQADALTAGYPLVLVAIAFAGCIQFILARFGVARLCAAFPSAAIEGMLCAIGLLIAVKQLPLFLGVSFHTHEFWDMLEEAGANLLHGYFSWPVACLGLGCLAALFILNALPWRVLKIMPPPVWVFFGGTVLAQLFLRLDTRHLIQVPEGLLANGIHLPDFRTVFAHPALWGPLAYLVFILILIDGTESLATILAVDKLDPYQRQSSPDATLQAMGASNLASSMLGGLTIIPGIVKSTANIIGGGRTQWANFYNALCLTIFLVFGRGLINMVPKAVLASILVFIGYKLARPKVWKHVARIGVEQFVIFTVTVLVTVTTDLLIGVFTGVLLKLMMVAWYIDLNYRLSANGNGKAASWKRFLDLFRNPVTKKERTDSVYHLYLTRPMVCFNLVYLIRELERVPPEAREIQIHLCEGVALIDHTTYETLDVYVERFRARQESVTVILNGLRRLVSLSAYERGMKMARLEPVQTTD